MGLLGSGPKRRDGLLGVPRETVINGQPHLLGYINADEIALLQAYRGGAPPWKGPKGIPAFGYDNENMGGGPGTGGVGNAGDNGNENHGPGANGADIGRGDYQGSVGNPGMLGDALADLAASMNKPSTVAQLALAPTPFGLLARAATWAADKARAAGYGVADPTFGPAGQGEPVTAMDVSGMNVAAAAQPTAIRFAGRDIVVPGPGAAATDGLLFAGRPIPRPR